MTNFINILIIEDHPLTAQAYKNILTETLGKKNKLAINIYSDIDSTLVALKNESFFEKLDLIFLDISLPTSKDKSVLSGEDLGLKFRKRFPEMKIVIATVLNDNYRIHSILKNLDPDGLLIKNDLTPKELTRAIEALINGSPFYSSTVLKMIRSQIKENFYLDDIDRKMLYELSLGTKMKELPIILNLSTGGVERRKRNLRMIFDVEEKGDRALVKSAKERGFI